MAVRQAWGSAAKQPHPALGTVEGALVARGEAAMRAHEATAAGCGHGPVDGRQAHRVLVREDVGQDPAEDPLADAVVVAAHATATPADDATDDHVAGRLVPVRRDPADHRVVLG